MDKLYPFVAIVATLWPIVFQTPKCMCIVSIIKILYERIVIATGTDLHLCNPILDY